MKKQRWIAIKSILFCLIFFIFLNPAFAGMNSPFQKKKKSTPKIYETSTTRLVLKGLVNFYSYGISPIDGPRSPSYPTGSAYGRNAIQAHGFFLGVLLTADRLIHEAGQFHGPYIMKYGVKRYYDPLLMNTFWWEK